MSSTVELRGASFREGRVVDSVDASVDSREVPSRGSFSIAAAQELCSQRSFKESKGRQQGAGLRSPFWIQRHATLKQRFEHFRNRDFSSIPFLKKFQNSMDDAPETVVPDPVFCPPLPKRVILSVRDARASGLKETETARSFGKKQSPYFKGEGKGDVETP